MAGTTAPVYEVTATKRRPKTFDELAGQEFVVSTLKNSLQNGRVANAYLFSGPRGCGKTSAARILARSLNCEKSKSGTPEGASGEPCGSCGNCMAISQGASMDVIEIDGASNNSVNDVRQIKDEVLFPPQAGRYKVYIIDEVHMLSGSAFNALLKTIEEPPPYIVFIFATTELHKVPATIKSRCQQFNFRLIPIETIQDLLKKTCAGAGIQAEDEALFWIAKESTGSLRDAYTLFDQVASFSGSSIRSDLIREKLGLVGLEKLNALAEACAANDSPGAFAIADEILSSGVAIEQFVIDLAGYYRSMLLLKNGVTRESLLGYRVNLFSAKVLDAFDAIRLEQALDILLDCYRNIRYSISPRFELETAVSKLTWLSDWVTPVELKNALENAKSALGGALKKSANNASPSGQSAGAGRYTAEMPASAYDVSAKGGIAGPLAEGGMEPPLKPSPQGGSRSLSDDFRRIIVNKTAPLPHDEGPETQAANGIFANDAEEDVPFWSSIAHNNNRQEDVQNAPMQDVLPQVDRLLRLIPGTVVQ